MAFGVDEAHSCSFQRHHSSVMQNFQVLFLVQLAHTPRDKYACEFYPLSKKERKLKRGFFKHCCGCWLYCCSLWMKNKKLLVALFWPIWLQPVRSVTINADWQFMTAFLSDSYKKSFQFRKLLQTWIKLTQLICNSYHFPPVERLLSIFAFWTCGPALASCLGVGLLVKLRTSKLPLFTRICRKRTNGQPDILRALHGTSVRVALNSSSQRSLQGGPQIPLDRFDSPQGFCALVTHQCCASRTKPGWKQAACSPS